MEMKKFLFMPALAVIAAVSFSCSKENIEGNETAAGNDAVAGNDTESAYFAPRSEISASSNTTKTTLNGREILWADGDAITLFGAENGQAYQYNIVSGQGTTSASFGISELPDQQMTAYAVYPAAESVLSGTSVSVNIPASQTYAADGFSASYPMAAVTSDGEHFTFNNLATVLSIPLKGDAAVKSITVEAKGGEGLAGAAAIDFADGAPVLKAAAEGFASSVTLNCDPAVEITADTETAFNFIHIPGTYSKGFKVTVTKSDDTTFETSTPEEEFILKPGSIKVFSPVTLSESPLGWNLVGSFTNGWAGWINMEESHGIAYCMDVDIPEENIFKIRKDGTAWYGLKSQSQEGEEAPEYYEIATNRRVETFLDSEGGNVNMSVPANVYDIYYDTAWFSIFVMNAGTSPFSVIGPMGDWDTDRQMIFEDGYFVLRDVQFEANGKFKIRTTGTPWDDYNIGLPDAADNVEIGETGNTVVKLGGQDMIVSESGTYDIWFDLGATKVWVMTAGQTPSGL